MISSWALRSWILSLTAAFAAAVTRGAQRPNILWLTCEDTTLHLAAYLPERIEH